MLKQRTCSFHFIWSRTFSNAPRDDVGEAVMGAKPGHLCQMIRKETACREVNTTQVYHTACLTSLWSGCTDPELRGSLSPPVIFLGVSEMLLVCSREVLGCRGKMFGCCRKVPGYSMGMCLGEILISPGRCLLCRDAWCLKRGACFPWEDVGCPVEMPGYPQGGPWLLPGDACLPFA